jgi:hypothetical protein
MNAGYGLTRGLTRGQVAEGGFEFEGFGGDGAGVFVPEGVENGRTEREFFAMDALYFADPGFGIEFGEGQEFAFRWRIRRGASLEGASGLLLGRGEWHPE